MNEFKTAFFIPGDNEKMLSKAVSIDADLIIFDLEDSVREPNKQLARELVTQALQSNFPHQPALGVRVNALDTEHTGADLDLVMAANPDVIVLPKTESGDQLAGFSAMLDHYEQVHGYANGSTKIVAITAETAASLLTYDTLNNANNRLVAMSWGPEDLATELGAESNRDSDGKFLPPFELARTLCLAKARALGVQPIDTVHANIKDLDGLKEECLSAKSIGYTGKLAIHPTQLSVINQAFTPTASEIAKAQEIIAMFDADPSRGAFQLDGKMVDIPHVKMARRILLRATENENS